MPLQSLMRQMILQCKKNSNLPQPAMLKCSQLLKAPMRLIVLLKVLANRHLMHTYQTQLQILKKTGADLNSKTWSTIVKSGQLMPLRHSAAKICLCQQTLMARFHSFGLTHMRNNLAPISSCSAKSGNLSSTSMCLVPWRSTVWSEPSTLSPKSRARQEALWLKTRRTNFWPMSTRSLKRLESADSRTLPCSNVRESTASIVSRHH